MPHLTHRSHLAQRSLSHRACCCRCRCHGGLRSPTPGAPLLLLLEPGSPGPAGRSTGTRPPQGSASHWPPHRQGTCAHAGVGISPVHAYACSFSLWMALVASAHVLGNAALCVKAAALAGPTTPPCQGPANVRPPHLSSPQGPMPTTTSSMSPLRSSAAQASRKATMKSS